ncbi:B3 domain-containing transcription factor VRN1-like isoform X2 [Apium graveolens]
MPGKSNSFFKIILTDVGSHNKLLFPKKFVTIFGKNLKDSVSLTTPSGSQWLVELKRHKGEVWLQNGWPEFAKFYSICFGYLLVFKYNGDSNFRVSIFEPSALEIDYPVNFVKSTPEKKRVLEIDDFSSSESSDNVLRPCKKTRTKAPSSKASSKPRQEKEKTGNEVAKYRALALANAFQSKNPFFIHVMKESHLVGGGWPNVYIPKNFKEAHKNWKTNDQLILHFAEESWVVYCNLNIKCGQCRISRGWTIFARDNSLSVGDVCVFELINLSKKWFQVIIHRAANDANDAEIEKLPRSEVDKARVLESVKAFKPKHPNFTVEVKYSYLYGGSITVPVDFISRHITKDSCKVNLKLPDGEVWKVKCYINKKCAKFSAGWKNFAKENNLAVGDICGFELVKERLFRVVIFRVKSGVKL